MNWRRFDTLAARLFALMWVTLVLSHLVARTLALPLGAWLDGSTWPPPGADLRPMPSAPNMPHLPPVSALPPGGPFDPGPPRAWAGEMQPPEPHRQPPGPLPANVLWIDYALRALVIALGAALGARWAAAPMRRLARAAQVLSATLSRGKAPTPLQERHGTAEVQAAAAAFNAMAGQLHGQFDARSLQMAALSHDLRTPLTRLRMRLTAAPPALADAASADIHEMSEMVDATLAVLREQRDGAPPAPLDLRALLQALVDDFQAAGADIELADGPGLRALARPAALRRVLDNLVGNALHYGQRARLTLRLDTGAAEVTVDDEGPGIPDAQLAQVFMPWVRLDAGLLPGAGHGLGLAIARDLAERDGASLTLANRAEGGLRATLRLPAMVSTPTDAR